MDFTGQLLRWYDENKRDLPWRRTRDPYLIWLSEIILQQTRISQGLPYYERFIQNFPTVRDLADATEQDVLKLWQGLGYYSRARNMHFAASQVVQEHGGHFPSNYEAIRSLKGVGDYTAAAIGSISFNIPVPVVDGNVLRFFARHFGVREPIDSSTARKTVYNLALEMIRTEDPGSFNQAMMEFGALYCKPAAPGCNLCTFRQSCFACTHGMVSQLPVKGKEVKQRTRYFHYVIRISAENHAILMNKREGNDIWKGLYDFPMIETSKPAGLRQLTKLPEWNNLTRNLDGTIIHKSGLFRHQLTHQTIIARFYILENGSTLLAHKKGNALNDPGENTAKGITLNDPGEITGKWIAVSNLGKIPVPKLIERFLKNLQLTSET